MKTTCHEATYHLLWLAQFGGRSSMLTEFNYFCSSIISWWSLLIKIVVQAKFQGESIGGESREPQKTWKQKLEEMSKRQNYYLVVELYPKYIHKVLIKKVIRKYNRFFFEYNLQNVSSLERVLWPKKTYMLQLSSILINVTNFSYITILKLASGRKCNQNNSPEKPGCNLVKPH